MHPRIGCWLAKKMTNTARHPIDRFQRNRFGRYGNRAAGAQNASQHVIINNQCRKRQSHKASLRTAGLRDDIGPCMNRLCDIQTFFIAALRVGAFAIGRPGNC